MSEIHAMGTGQPDLQTSSEVTGNYLREYSAGGILRNSLAIYRQHFVAFFLISLVAWIPFEFLYDYAAHVGHGPLTALMFFVTYLASEYALSVMTLCVADIYVGNPLNAMGAFRRVNGRLLGKLIVTNVIGGAIAGVGLVLFVVPGVIWILWILLTSMVVVIEGRSGWDALMRSRQLGKGYYLRNAAIVFVAALVFIIAMLLVGGAIAFVVGFLGDLRILDSLAFTWVTTALKICGAPFVFISMILIYYDMRVRKEGYDRQALIQDMMR